MDYLIQFFFKLPTYAAQFSSLFYLLLAVTVAGVVISLFFYFVKGKY